MENRFETGRSLMEMHREQIAAHTRVIFEEQGKCVDGGESTIFDNGYTALHQTNMINTLSVEAITRSYDADTDYYQYGSTALMFFNRTGRVRVTSLQGEGRLVKAGEVTGERNLLSQVKVEYGPINEQGEVRLFNPTIDMSHPQAGRHVYLTSERMFDWRSGEGLIMNDTEEVDALSVRVDHDSKKLVFPNTLNIYQKLSEAQDQLRNGGPHGK